MKQTLIFGCRCGQLTLGSGRPETVLCTRCGKHDFTCSLCFQAEQLEHASSSWVQQEWFPASDDDSDELFGVSSEAIRLPAALVINQDPKLSISRARCLLDYLEMLHRGEQISRDRYEQERERVLRCVFQLVTK